MALVIDASLQLRRYVTRAILNGFDHTSVTGLTQDPVITQTITSRTPEPYIYVREVQNEEINETKGSARINHSVEVEVKLKYGNQRGDHDQRDQIVAEVTDIVDRLEGDNLPGDDHNIYIIERDTVIKNDFELRGARYFVAIIPFSIRVQYIGAPSTRPPVQRSLYTYSGFQFNPKADLRLERYDAGTITPATTYPTPNAGWDFVNVTTLLDPASQGTLAAGVVTVGADDAPILINNSLNYALTLDSTVLETVNNMDRFDRIVSLRYGAAPANSGTKPAFSDDSVVNFGLRRLQNWQGPRRFIDTDNSSVNNTTVNISVEAGEYIYIVLDSAHPDLTAITENVFNQDVLDIFDAPVTIGAFKYYIQTTAQPFSASYQYTLI